MEILRTNFDDKLVCKERICAIDRARKKQTLKIRLQTPRCMIASQRAYQRKPIEEFVIGGKMNRYFLIGLSI